MALCPVLIRIFGSRIHLDTQPASPLHLNNVPLLRHPPSICLPVTAGRMIPSDFSSLSIARISEYISVTDQLDEAMLQVLETDSRSGVRKLALRERKLRQAETAERARLEKMLLMEKNLRNEGLSHIAGVDEAGRGPLAGPVVAAAVILSDECRIPGINDSKVLKKETRERLYDQIVDQAVAFGIGQATSEEIDKHNILQATFFAMRRALDELSVRPDRVLVDGKWVPESRFHEIAVIDGDAKSLSIAAASILAKVTRDRQMAEYHQQYPEYGFDSHKGYGSHAHLEAIREHGPCPIHRLTFQGVVSADRSRSEDFHIFAEGISLAGSEEELEAIGHSIKSASADLPEVEIEDLRALYIKKQKALSNTWRRGEGLAARELSGKGYTILERNYRAGGGEIDLIAVKDQILAFVEVKTVNAPVLVEPETRVTPGKQKQIAMVASVYIRNNAESGFVPRFDVIGINLSNSPPALRHIEAAFLVNNR